MLICPNKCMAGEVKHYPDPTKALWTLVKCKCCNGAGYVSDQLAEKHIQNNTEFAELFNNPD